jgi:hypothetical protein
MDQGQPSDRTPDPLPLDPGEGWVPVAERWYDPATDEDLTAALVFALAEAEGVEPTALDGPVLYDCVDASAVETAVFGCDQPRQGLEAVSFRYRRYAVVVRRDGRIRVYEPRG